MCSFFSSVGITNQKNHVFLALELTRSDQHLEEGEIIAAEWVPLEEAIKMVFAGKVLNVGAAYGLLLANEWLSREEAL
jgi:hypothetical protein